MHKGYSLNWLPLHNEMIESKKFADFTPIQQNYYLFLMKEFNTRQGEFYKADLEFQALLDCSISSIRKARRKFKRIGWIDYKKGTRANGKNLATRYTKVKYAKPEKNKEGNSMYFVAFDKYILEVLAHHIRKGSFSHKDLLVYVVLWYYYGSKRFLEDEERTFQTNQLNQPLDLLNDYARDDVKVFISKTHLARLAGLSIEQAVKSVYNLYESFEFASGAKLFEFKDQYHQLSINQFATFANPGEGKDNSRNADKYIYDVKQKSKELRENRELEEKSTGDNLIKLGSKG